MRKRSDLELLNMLRSTVEKEVDQGLTYLYKVSHKAVSRFIRKNKGNLQDVDDTFHDGLIAFYNMVRQDKIQNDTNVEAYLYSICRNIWVKKLKNKPQVFELTETYQNIPVAPMQISTIIEGENKKLIETILGQLGQPCQQLLLLYYFQRLRIKEIVKQMNFSNDQVARNKKSHCMKKLRSIVLDSPLYKDLLLNLRR